MRIAGRSNIIKPKICLISFNSYPILSRAKIPIAGGAELQQVLLAHALQQNGFDVSVIVLDYGQKSIEVRDGVKIIKSARSDLLSRKPRTLLSILYSYVVAPFLFWRSLKWISADIYLQKMIGPSSALVALFCLLKKRRFIYSVSSDIELEIEDLASKDLLARFLCQFAIKKANGIIAQSKYQQRLLKANFNKKSVLIKNISALPMDKTAKVMPPIVLWVATIRKVKQPELFLKLAREIPEAKFQMIGGNPSEKDTGYFEQIKEQASHLPNVEFVGFVPYHQVNAYFARASIFVSTSNSEGFSNTFVQAWVKYTPVVSLNSDPDEVICEKRLGFHSRAFEQMTKDVKLLLKDEKLRAEMGMNGRRYTEEEHDVERIVKQYTELFEQLAGRGR